jgi:hypothetical protein
MKDDRWLLPSNYLNPVTRGAIARKLQFVPPLGNQAKKIRLLCPRLLPVRGFASGEPKPASEVWQSVDLGRTSDAERQKCCNNRNQGTCR